MSGIAFQVSGLNELITKVSKLSDNVREEAEGRLEQFCGEVVLKAKQRVPKDIGGGDGLAASIQFKPLGPATFEIFVAKEYAPFVEFGTGTLVDVPAELTDYALQFKGRGIRQVNLKARPFFFNTFFEEKRKLVAELQKLLQ